MMTERSFLSKRRTVQPVAAWAVALLCGATGCGPFEHLAPGGGALYHPPPKTAPDNPEILNRIEQAEARQPKSFPRFQPAATVARGKSRQEFEEQESELKALQAETADDTPFALADEPTEDAAAAPKAD